MSKIRCVLLSLVIGLVLSNLPMVECNQNKMPSEVQVLQIGGIDPPIIGWYYSITTNWSEHTTTGVHFHLYYEGQTEHLWSYTSHIYDSDGIDTVFFQYRHTTDGEWMNRTPSLISGDSFDGQYSYTYVQEIWWDWESNQAVMESGSYTAFRIFANDSLGNWRITMPTFQDTPLMTLNPPLFVWIVQGAPFIVAMSIIGFLFVIVVIRRIKQRAAF